jgi:hypothetical protein
MSEDKVAEGKPTTLAELDLKNMPKIGPEAFQKPTAALKYHIEIIMKDSAKNMAFDIMGGEEAAKFVDSYQKMVETKSVIARWAIGGSMYSIPLDNVLFVRMDRPSPQDMMNAGQS